MKTAVLYSRTAIPVQTQKKTSLETEQNNMINFCQLKSIKVDRIFFDTASGKNFDRPAYQEMEKYVRKTYKKIDYILVADWSRFSRNVSAAILEIAQFKKLGVDVICYTNLVDTKDINPKPLRLLPIVKLHLETENKLGAKVSVKKTHTKRISAKSKTPKSN